MPRTIHPEQVPLVERVLVVVPELVSPVAMMLGAEMSGEKNAPPGSAIAYISTGNHLGTA